jgi:predicted ATPase/DNA-binding CsgD family transcriptional regulator
VTARIACAKLVGRRKELKQLGDAAKAARAGHACLVLVGGDAGVGKTRLLDEFVADLHGVVLRGACLPLGESGLPFSPFVEVLQSLVGKDSMPSAPPLLARLLPGPPAESSPGQSSQAELFHAFLILLKDLANDGTITLLLEDIHWADHSTRQMLTFLTHNLRDQRLLVVSTYRTDEIHREHPLRPLLAELRRNAHVESVELAPFEPSELAEYLAAVTESRPSPEMVSTVVERTEGNAYFIEELVAAEGLTDHSLPESLSELLLVRVEALSPAAQRILRMASAAGRTFNDSLIAEVGGTPQAEVIELLREAVSRKILVAEGHAYRFRHALLREALQRDLLPGERGVIHSSYARTLADAPHLGAVGDAASRAELAYHWQQAGDPARSLGAWIKAGEAAERMYAFGEARHHYEQALDVWDRVANAPDRAGSSRVEILQRASETAFLSGDAERASELARDAIALVDPENERTIAGVLHESLARFVWATTDRNLAMDIQRTAVELVPAHPPSKERAHVLAGLGGQLMKVGRYREALRVSEEALTLARAVGAKQPEYFALNTLGTVICTLEDVDKGLRLLGRALDMAVQNGDAQEQRRAYWNLYASTLDAGWWEEALKTFDVVGEALRILGQGHLVPVLHVSAADCHFRLGRWDEAERMIETGRTRQRPGEEPIRLPELDIARGNDSAVADHLEHLRAEERVLDLPLRGWWQGNLAELAVWQGRYRDARTEVEVGLGLTGDLDDPLPIGYLCTVGLRAEANEANKARVMRRKNDVLTAGNVGSRLVDAIRKLLERPGPANGWKREVGALRAQCEAEWMRLQGKADSGAWAEAAGAWDQLNMPYPASYCRWQQAEALVATSSRQRAGELLTQAHETASALGADPLLGKINRFADRARISLTGGQSIPKPVAKELTPRESSVLELLVEGRSNRQIAEVLFITEKTASVHVSNIMRKLQASSRGEATAEAFRRGLVG